MAATETEKPAATQETQPGEAALKSDGSTLNESPQDEDSVVYPKGITVVLIIASLCLSVFLVNENQAL